MTEKEWRMQRELVKKIYDKVNALRIKEREFNQKTSKQLDEAIEKSDKEMIEHLETMFDLSCGYENAYYNVLAILDGVMASL